MDTLSHGLWGFIVKKPGRHTPAFIFGAVLPDLPFIIGGMYKLWQGAGITNLHEQVIPMPGVFFWSSFWHSYLVLAAFYAMLHSVPLAASLSGGWVTHLLLDILTHAGDASPLFWPISDWRTLSPISYWQPAFGGRWFAVLNGVLLFWLLLRRLKSTLLRRNSPKRTESLRLDKDKRG